MTEQELEILLKEFGFPIFDNRIDAAKQRILDIFDSTYSLEAVTDGFTIEEMVEAAKALEFQVIETSSWGAVSTVTIMRPSDERFASFHHVNSNV